MTQILLAILFIAIGTFFLLALFFPKDGITIGEEPKCYTVYTEEGKKSMTQKEFNKWYKNKNKR